MENPKAGQRYARIIESVDQLPALPAIVQRLVDVVNSPESSAEDASRLIEKDPALTSRMLRLANSAFYGIPRSISSVSSAVVILGFNTIKSLVLSASVMQMFPGDKNVIFDRARFWKHSIVCAMAAKQIIKAYMPVKMMDPESAFCAGMLHDIGKLVFEQYAHQDYVEACDYAQKTGISLLEAETHMLGTNHAEVGKILADRWALPLELEAALVWHHEPQAAGKLADLVGAVHVADSVAHNLNVEVWDDEKCPTEWPAARGLLRLNDQSLTRITEEVRQEIEKSDEFFSVISQ